MKVKREKTVDSYITEALFNLMKKKDYNSISISEITIKAGVNRISFYRNFNSKDEIIEKWIHDITNNFLKTSNISYKNDSTKDYFIKLFTHLEKYKEQGKLICKANLTYLLKQEFDDILLKIYEEEYSAYKSYFIAGGIFNVYYYWLISGCKETPDTIANKLVDFMKK